jgi:hypothetical protein
MYEAKHNRSEMVAVLWPFEALPYYIHTYVPSTLTYQENSTLYQQTPFVCSVWFSQKAVVVSLNVVSPL